MAATLEPVLTGRLRLRLPDAGDAGAMSALMTPAVSARLAHWPVPFTPDLARQRIADSIVFTVSGRGMIFAVERLSDGAFLGIVSFRRSDHDPRLAGMGYWLGEEFHGQGYMREAALAACGAAFARLDLDTIEAGCQPDNGSSLAVIRALGMVATGERTVDVPARGRQERVLYFAVRRNGSAPILGP